jgi:hypothetical protein
MAGGDQRRGGEDRQERLAPARRHRGEDVARLRLARGDRLDDGRKLALVGAERSLQSSTCQPGAGLLP